MKNIIIILVLAAVVGLGYWAINLRQASAPVAPSAPSVSAPTSPATPTKPTTQPKTSAKKVVVYQNNAFTPSPLTISVGDTVVFVNKHTAPIRIPSNPHPFHTSMPEFDSDTLAPGESYEFTFKKSGVLNYHNHFNPAVQGQIIIK